MRFELLAALRYLRHTPGRTALLLTGITVGSAALVIALALMTGFHQDIRSRILEGTAHLTVTHRFDLTFEGADALRERLEQRLARFEAAPTTSASARRTVKKSSRVATHRATRALRATLQPTDGYGH